MNSKSVNVVRALIRLNSTPRHVYQYSGSRVFCLELPKRWTSTSPSSSQKTLTVDHATEEPLISKLDLTFEDNKTAFKSKSSMELLRGYLVFQLCSVNFIVQNQKMLLNLSRKLLGRTLFSGLMKSTFFGHFCAGVDEQEIKPKLEKMLKFGVRSLLNYSAEEDLQTEKANVKIDETVEKSKVVIKRKLYHDKEAQFENNANAFIACLETIDKVTEGTGRAALKITSLLRPELLVKFSSFTTILEKFDQFKDILKWKKLSSMDEKEWREMIDTVLAHSAEKIEFTSNEINELRNMVSRVDEISKFAVEKNIVIFVDAEQTYFQNAIRRLAVELMRHFNTKHYIICNTYQHYLKGIHEKLVEDIQLSLRENFYFGAKLVKGAYMEQERERAKDMGYEDPIQDCLESTNKMYMKSLSYCLKVIKSQPLGRMHITAASHSEETVKFAIEQMAEFGIKPQSGILSFGQLLGMCDYISFYLGSLGYHVYKFVPYGPVEEVLPYLSRRVMENQGIFDKVKKEKRLLARELKRRFNNSILFQNN